MAIKGLTDRGLSFPEIGQIRKGGPKGTNTPGKDLTYFRVEFAEQEPEAAAEFKRIYGAQPTEIRIILPFNEIERQWEAWLEAYTAGRLVARSDGERFIYKVSTKTGEVEVKNGLPETLYKDGMIVGSWHNTKTNKDEPITCKPTGRLKVILPELARAAYLTVLTTSIHDIANISAQLEAFRTLNNGQIAGIPLMLRRRPKKISTPMPDGTRGRFTKWMVSIEADPQWVKAMLTKVKRLALPGNGPALLAEHSGAEEEYIDVPAGYVDDEGDEGEQPGEQEQKPAPTAAAPKSNGQPAEPNQAVGAPASALEQAAVMRTPKGALMGNLDDATLAAISVHAKATPEQKTAAELLLAKPDSEAWAAWYALASQRAELGLADIPQPADNISACGLRRLVAEWAPKVNAAVDNKVPAEFR